MHGTTSLWELGIYDRADDTVTTYRKPVCGWGGGGGHIYVCGGGGRCMCGCVGACARFRLHFCLKEVDINWNA